jgi:hypothetical protein
MSRGGSRKGAELTTWSTTVRTKSGSEARNEFTKLRFFDVSSLKAAMDLLEKEVAATPAQVPSIANECEPRSRISFNWVIGLIVHWIGDLTSSTVRRVIGFLIVFLMLAALTIWTQGSNGVSDLYKYLVFLAK